MPRVNPLVKDYEGDFGAELKATIVRNRMRAPDVAKKVGFTYRTLMNRFVKPSDMTLGQMKLFIKATGIDKETVINYLYEGK
jgi:hypothetical protein